MLKLSDNFGVLGIDAGGTFTDPPSFLKRICL